MNLISTKRSIIIAILLQTFVSTNVMSSILTIDVTQMAQEQSRIQLQFSHFDTDSNSTEFDQVNSDFNLIYYWGTGNQVAFGSGSAFSAYTDAGGSGAQIRPAGTMSSNVTGMHSVTSNGNWLGFYDNPVFTQNNGSFSLDFLISGTGYQFISSNFTQTEINFTPGQVSSVPVPAAIWLMGSALLGLFGVSRRN